MIRHRRSVLAALSLVPATLALAGVPAYRTFEIQARSNIVDGYNLPPNSSFNSGTPAINDDARVAFRLIYVGAGASGLFLGGGGVGSVVYLAPADRFIEDPSINAEGDAGFEQFDVLSDGVFVHDASSGLTSLAVPTGGAHPFTAATRAQLGDDGSIGMRGTNSGNFILHVAPGGGQSLVVSEGGGLSFLFTPAYGDDGRFAAKARFGGTANDRPDEIRLWNVDGTHTVLVRDRDADPLSPYSGFDNSVDRAGGRVAFIASLVAGGRGVFLTDGTTTTTIATTADPALSEISFFPPACNAAGLVAFRGKTGDGRHAVFVGDGTSFAPVVAEHDLLPCDLGTARIDQHDGSITFGGGVDLNARGDLVFNCTLTPENDSQVEWGSGIYVAYAEVELPGDIDGDGTVGFADVLAVLAAWGPCPAKGACPADLDGDGVVAFADLLLVLANWSA